MAIRVGDIYVIETEQGQAKLFHHVINDATQLGSNVIRVFSPSYRIDALPSPSEIIQSEVEFHAHVFCKLGIKLGTWRKVGHIKPNSEVKVWFRDSNDYGNPSITVSKNWWVWRVNQPSKAIGALHGKYLKSEIGVVIPPSSIESRINNGHYDFVYPRYE